MNQDIYNSVEGTELSNNSCFKPSVHFANSTHSNSILFALVFYAHVLAIKACLILTYLSVIYVLSVLDMTFV